MGREGYLWKYGRNKHVLWNHESMSTTTNPLLCTVNLHNENKLKGLEKDEIKSFDSVKKNSMVYFEVFISRIVKLNLQRKQCYECEAVLTAISKSTPPSSSLPVSCASQHGRHQGACHTGFKQYSLTNVLTWQFTLKLHITVYPVV